MKKCLLVFFLTAIWFYSCKKFEPDTVSMYGKIVDTDSLPKSNELYRFVFPYKTLFTKENDIYEFATDEEGHFRFDFKVRTRPSSMYYFYRVNSGKVLYAVINARTGDCGVIVDSL